MTEVCNCGGGRRTRLRINDLVSLGCPLPPYIKEGEGEAAGPRGAPRCGVLLGLPSPSRIPPPIRSRKGGRERERKEGAAPPPLVQFGLGKGGRAPPHVACLSFSRMAQ
jgi:hypothetical protein